MSNKTIVAYGVEVLTGDLSCRCLLLNHLLWCKFKEEYGDNYKTSEEFIKEYNITSEELFIIMDDLEIDPSKMIHSTLESLNINYVIGNNYDKYFLYHKEICASSGLQLISINDLKKEIDEFCKKLQKIKIALKPKLCLYTYNPEECNKDNDDDFDF
jgi:alpha-galactosidase/6-phospho-beta-glucosidase family protein